MPPISDEEMAELEMKNEEYMNHVPEPGPIDPNETPMEKITRLMARLSELTGIIQDDQ